MSWKDEDDKDFKNLIEMINAITIKEERYNNLSENDKTNYAELMTGLNDLSKKLTTKEKKEKNDLFSYKY